jgi:hypothetical protein
MPSEWKRNNASRKGIGVHVSGQKQSGEAVGIVHVFDSAGSLDKLQSGCPRIPVVLSCEISCSSCVATISGGLLQFPPGTIVGPPQTTTSGCCP